MYRYVYIHTVYIYTCLYIEIHLYITITHLNVGGSSLRHGTLAGQDRAPGPAQVLGGVPGPVEQNHLGPRLSEVSGWFDHKYYRGPLGKA